MAITYDNVSSGTGSAVSPKTVSHTIGSGSNRILVVATQIENTTEIAITGITYNSVAMTKIDHRTSSDTAIMRVELWYILEANLPSTGAYDISVTWASAPAQCIVGGISLAGVAQQAPEASAGNTVGASDTITADITTLTNGAWIVDSVGCGNQGTNYTANNQTERYDTTVGTTVRGGGSTREVVSAGLVTNSWTFSTTANRQALFGAAFAPISGGRVIYIT